MHQEMFTFVDAAHLISKANLWQERDKAIQEKHDKLNNEVLPKVVAFDKETRIGCKGKEKFWYAYKQHTSVDMQSGLINKVAITPANEIDGRALKQVCPNEGGIYADKAYCIKPARRAAAKKGCHLAAIKKNNMVDKNKELDRWYSHLRSTYERVFSCRLVSLLFIFLSYMQLLLTGLFGEKFYHRQQSLALFWFL